jgi:hypothetical protein
LISGKLEHEKRRMGPYTYAAFFVFKGMIMKLPRRRKEEVFKHFIQVYKHQWDLNRHVRDDYDEDLEYYLSYRPRTRYPLAYNESFNKLLPRVMTILSRFMSQLYQGGTSNLVSVRPRKRSDVERAPRIEGLLNFQLETLNDIDMQGGSYWTNYQWMLNALSFGKGILKLYWRREERIAPKRITVPDPQFDDAGNLVGIGKKDVVYEEPQIVYDGPYAEVLHNKLFVPHPNYKSIQQMPAVFCVYKKPIEYVKKMAEEGKYDSRSVKDIGWSSPTVAGTSGDSGLGQDSCEAFAKSLEIEGAISATELRTERVTPEIDIIEGYGRYIFPEDESAYEVGSGVKIKGRESEAIVHIGNYKTLLNIQKNNYGMRPFYDIGAYTHPEMFWDIGIIRLGKGIQELVNDMSNLRAQNAMMLVNQMLKVNKDADIDPAALVWKPFGLIPVDDFSDVQPLEVSDASQSRVFMEQEQFFEGMIEEITGMYRYSMGAEPQRAEKVGTVYSIQQMAEARTRLLLMTMDHTGFKPLLKGMMMLNLFHLPSEFETRINTPQGQGFTPLWPSDLHVDYDFTARYTSMEPALGKMQRSQQLLQYSQLWQQSPYLQHHEFMKAIMELMDFHDTDKYLKSPEQLQQEQQQQQQMVMQAKMMEYQVQDQLDAQKQQREFQGKAMIEMIKD